jgi:hypothetical protein
MENPSFPWKRSYRSIPPAVATALNTIKSDLVIVAATKKLRFSRLPAANTRIWA